jgi:hypothetical protein
LPAESALISGEEFRHRTGFAVNQADGAAADPVAAGGIDAQGLQDGGDEVVDLDRAVFDGHAAAVGAADDQDLEAWYNEVQALGEKRGRGPF